MLFVAGFATFVIGLFGLVGTVLGDVIYDAKNVVRIMGGITLILFGLFTLRIVNIPALQSDTRGAMLNTAAQGAGVLQPYLMGWPSRPDGHPVSAHSSVQSYRSVSMRKVWHVNVDWTDGAMEYVTQLRCGSVWL